MIFFTYRLLLSAQMSIIKPYQRVASARTAQYTAGPLLVRCLLYFQSKRSTLNIREYDKIMEIEILVAVSATGLGIIGGMLVIWKDYRGPRH